MAADLLIDGLPATEADLQYLALVNYGAYTAFRVEAGGVRGLDLHLARLEVSCVELFGEPLGADRLREILRAAIGDSHNAWVRVSLFSSDIWPRTPSAHVRPKVLTAVSPPPPPLATSVRVQARTYSREDAHIKHTATLGLVRARRLARQEGFDDALFADTDGLISEGSSWNIGFLSGDRVIWPRAPMLNGVAQSLIQDGLEAVDMSGSIQPIHLADLAEFDGVFLCNSATPACPITAIGDYPFAADPDRLKRLRDAWAVNPLQAI